MTAAVRRRWEAISGAWPTGAAGATLLTLVAVGLLLRVIAAISWWPTVTTLTDAYERFTSSPFANPLHPAGYSLIIAAVGSVTREVAVLIVLQHLTAIASALLLWGATRRVTGSAWAGMLPAAIVLLDADLIFLEHAVMSESWIVLTTSIGLYATVRAFDEPGPWWRWPLVAGLALGASVTIRTAMLPLIPVAGLALLLLPTGPAGARAARWGAPLAVIGAAVTILLAFATANAAFGERFGLGASPGWYLYARAAQFADCEKFDPPPGTEVLCEDPPADERPGGRYYIVEPKSPGLEHFGPFGAHDGELGAWARRAILAQPGDYLASAWEYLRGYWVPAARPSRPLSGGELDPQLAFTNGLEDSGEYSPAQVPIIERAFQNSLETYFDDFTVHEARTGLEFLRGWQLAFRFGGTLLSITTVLTLIGLFIGDRRSRIGVLLFGVGGLALLIVPALTANYYGRYTVPMAAPMMAAAGITIVALWRRFGRGLRMPSRP